MNTINNFPVASKVRFTRESETVYEGIVAMHPVFDTVKGIKIEQCNKAQLSFVPATKLSGETGWALIPDPLPKNYAISQDVMLLSIEEVK